jgi:hypothetical protein
MLLDTVASLRGVFQSDCKYGPIGLDTGKQRAPELLDDAG